MAGRCACASKVRQARPPPLGDVALFLLASAAAAAAPEGPAADSGKAARVLRWAAVGVERAAKRAGSACMHDEDYRAAVCFASRRAMRNEVVTVLWARRESELAASLARKRRLLLVFARRTKRGGSLLILLQRRRVSGRSERVPLFSVRENNRPERCGDCEKCPRWVTGSLERLLPPQFFQWPSKAGRARKCKDCFYGLPTK